MAWLADYKDVKAAHDQAEKAMRLPVGLASPLWLAFGAAASAGVGWWWMTRWAKPANLEAMTRLAPHAAADPKVEVEPVAVAEAADAAPSLETVVEAIEAVAPPAPLVSESDDLTRLVGIGPKLADALAARGVTQFAQVAAWTETDVARFDRELNLRGRAARNQWVAQAKTFAA